MKVIQENPEDFGVRRSSRASKNLSESDMSDSSEDEYVSR